MSDELAQLAQLLVARDALDSRIAELVGQSARPGDVGEFIAARVFDLELAATVTQAGYDGSFRSGPLAGKTVNVKTYGDVLGGLDIEEDGQGPGLTGGPENRGLSLELYREAERSDKLLSAESDELGPPFTEFRPVQQPKVFARVLAARLICCTYPSTATVSCAARRSPAAAPGWEPEEGVDLMDAALDDHCRRRRLHPTRRNVTFGERMTMHEPVTELDERFSDPGAKATPWAKAREVLETAQLSWVTTVRGDGRPHVTPLVSVWLDDAVHFTTGPGEQKAVNLASNPHVVMTTGCNRWDQGLDVMVEGEAQRVTDRATLERLAAAWATKWNGQWQFEAADGGFAPDDAGGDGPVLVFAVKPAKILAFGKGEFSHTRYRPS